MGSTSLPEWARESAKRTQSAIAEAHAQHAGALAFLDQVWTTYEHAAGIDTGYGFFAPAVPNASKLVFEITYADGHPEYELPVVSDKPPAFASARCCPNCLGYVRSLAGAGHEDGRL